MTKDYRGYSFWLETCGDDLTPRSPLNGSIDGLTLLAEREGLFAKLPEGLCSGAARTNYAAASGAPETVRR